jgi:hypothetical protein
LFVRSEQQTQDVIQISRLWAHGVFIMPSAFFRCKRVIPS